MHPIIVGTAGHIDHGKTALVRALTGIDTDRLKEEKERGITTDLGFAYLDYADGARLAFIDVPGHERFIHNMLAGAFGIDVVLLVVAADEAVMPQTREHAEICRLLGVQRAVIALSKADLVDAETLEVVRLEVREFAAAGGLAGADVVPVSARTGQGLEELKAAIRTAAESAPARDASRPLRLPVDRVFSARGFGTVVTGTLWTGRIRVDQEVEVAPQCALARVRGLQVHHRPVEEAEAGQRAAVNLQGVSAEILARGSVLIEAGAYAPARLLVARLELAPEAARRARPGPLALHHGTLETTARWRWLDKPLFDARGARGLAALSCQDSLLAVRGDCFVLRRRSPPATLGGGVVLDALTAPHRRAALAEHARRLDGAPAPEAIVEDLRWGREPASEKRRLWVASGLERRSFEAALESVGRDGRALRAGEGLWIESGRLRELEREALDLLRSFHAGDGLQVGMPLEEFKRRLLGGAPRAFAEWLLARLQGGGGVRLERDRLALADHQVELGDVEKRLAGALEGAFRTAGLNPPEPVEALAGCGAPPQLGEKLLHLLVRSGRLVRIKSGRLYHAEAVQRLVEELRRYRDRSRKIDVGHFKELTGTSRKNAIPLLEHLDATRVTQRVGNERIIL